MKRHKTMICIDVHHADEFCSVSGSDTNTDTDDESMGTRPRSSSKFDEELSPLDKIDMQQRNSEIFDKLYGLTPPVTGRARFRTECERFHLLCTFCVVMFCVFGDN